MKCIDRQVEIHTPDDGAPGLFAMVRKLTSFALVLVALNAVPAAAQTGPNVTCSTSPSIFNTAFQTPAGPPLGPGPTPNTVTDAVWEAGVGTLAGGPGTVASYTPAYVVGNAAPGAWTDSPYNNANWISFYPDAVQGPAGSVNQDVFFRYDFTLDPSVTVSSFQLSLDFYADNAVVEVYVNGVAQSTQPNGAGVLPQNGAADAYQYQGYSAGNAASLVLNNSWHTGANEIIVWVASGPPQIGFLTQVTGTAVCPANIQISKTVDPSGGLHAGGTATYTITLTNTSTSVAADGVVVSDVVPAGLTSANWSCVGSTTPAVTCGSGTGNVSDTLASFPAGGVATYTLTATVAANPPASITNTASASIAGGLCTPGNTAAPCSAQATSSGNVPVLLQDFGVD